MFEFQFLINKNRCICYNYVTRHTWRLLTTGLPIIVLTFTQHRSRGRVRFGRPLFLKWQSSDQFLQNAFFHDLMFRFNIDCRFPSPPFLLKRCRSCVSVKKEVCNTFLVINHTIERNYFISTFNLTLLNVITCIFAGSFPPYLKQYDGNRPLSKQILLLFIKRCLKHNEINFISISKTQ